MDIEVYAVASRTYEKHESNAAEMWIPIRSISSPRRVVHVIFVRKSICKRNPDMYQRYAKAFGR
jgi:hypothetical protein